MAARRLQSDRFFTDDYTPETYTPEGLAWIEATTMGDVIRRTYPQLTPPENPFLHLAYRIRLSFADASWVTGRPWPVRITRGSSSAIRRRERR